MDAILSRFREADRKALYIQVVWIVIAVAFFAYIYAMALQMKLNDPDFWWHLKTGGYVLENWEVPDVDPFSYTTPRPLGTAQKIGLRSQWLGQVMLYTAHSIGGLTGVVMYRNLLIIMPMLLIFIWLVLKRVPAWQALIFISMPALMFCIQLFYSFERPQGVSFNLAIIACILLDRVRSVAGTRKFDFSYVLFPVLMAVWSNIHGGYLVGCYFIMIYMFSEAALFVYRRYYRKQEVEVPVRFFIILALAVVATGLNPNGYVTYINYTKGLVGMFVRDVSYYATGSGGGSWVKTVVLEFKPLSYFYTYLHYDWLLLYWMFSGLTVITMMARFILRREFDLSEFTTVAFLIVFANMYARGLMFSLAVLPFYLAKSVMLLEVPQKAYRIVIKTALVAALALALSFVVYTYRQTPQTFKPKVQKSWVSPWYPAGMVNFIKTAKPAAPMYNYYTWGGYLIWNIYPEYKVFIDGRALNNMINQVADHILKAYPGWQSKLDVYNINFIAIPVVFRESGHTIPLAPKLVDDDRWNLVYVGGNAALFVRNHPRNKEIIERYNRDKRHVYLEIIKISNLFLQAMPWNPVYNISKADALFGLGRYAEAKAVYEKFPRESVQPLKRLKQMGY